MVGKFCLGHVKGASAAGWKLSKINQRAAVGGGQSSGWTLGTVEGGAESRGYGHGLAHASPMETSMSATYNEGSRPEQ